MHNRLYALILAAFLLLPIRAWGQVVVEGVGASVQPQGESTPYTLTASLSGITPQSGDLLVAFISEAYNGVTVGVTPPSGWTLWPDSSVGGTSTLLAAFYTIYSGSGPSLTFTLTSSSGSIYADSAIVDLRTVNQSTPNDGNAATASAATSTTLTSNAVTPSMSGDALLVAFMGGGNSVSSVAPSGLINLTADSPFGGLWIGYLTGPTSGSATSAYEATYSASTDSSRAIQLLAAPPVSNTGLVIVP
jgi:hypothetical protein